MDKYDQAIQYLNDHPDELVNAWTAPSTHAAGCLFQFAVRWNSDVLPWATGNFGCLTMIRHQFNYQAHTDELTAAIRADDRIPMSQDITPAHLPVFAEWQRRLDSELCA